MAKRNSAKQINKAYHARMKQLIKGQRESEIFEALSAGKNTYMRMDRLESSSFDKSWIEIIEGVIFDLGEIIANPRMNTKTEGVLTPVELARKITGESVQHLANHSQYVKEIDEYGNVIPSKILSIASDDDLHTYENRFIATLVRRLLLFIEKRYEYVSKFAELRNEEVLFFKNKSIVDGAEVEIETKIKVSYKNDDEEALKSNDYIERIKETRRYILYFYNSPFMKAMKTERDVRNPIIQTNIIRKNPKYNHCYNVYRFIETYDRLGVNYKIDEQYSVFNNDEIRELNRTLFANYITLRGKDRSKNYKPTSKVYKPKVLTSMDDEAFIHGPLFEGPISFVRVDETYQKYLDSKIKQDLPLHPTKREKEYYADEYATKAEVKQDEKQLNDLLKRKQREVNEFERKVKAILAKREDAREKLLELEKQAIKQEENDLLEAMRKQIIADALAELGETLPEEPQEEQPVEETPAVEETPVVEEQPEQEEQPVEEVPEQEEVPQKEPVQVEEPAKETPAVEETPVAETSVEEPVEEPIPAEEVPAQEETPIEEEPVKEQPVYEPTVSFDDAIDEIWPQIKHPHPLPKEKKAPVKKAKKAEPKPVPVSEPVKEAEPVKEEAPAQEQPVVESKPLLKEEPQEEKKQAPKKKAAPKAKPQASKPVEKAKEEQPAPIKKEVKPEPQKEAAPEKVIVPTPVPRPAMEPPRRKIPGRFIVKTTNGYYVGPDKYSIDKDDAYVFDDFNLANDIKRVQGGKVIKL